MISIIFILLTSCSPAVVPPQAASTPTNEVQTTVITYTPTIPEATLPAPTPSPGPTQIPEKFLPIRDEIAKTYGLSADQVLLTTYEDIEWSDSCLGIEQPGMACIDVITPGYRLVFNTPQGNVEVHTNADATNFQIAASKSGIQGQAWISPACPGPVKLGRECPDLPYQGNLWILGEDGSVIAEITTNSDGSFEATLPPGTYTITQPKGTALPALPPQEVTVSPGQFTQIELILDSGLR